MKQLMRILILTGLNRVYGCLPLGNSIGLFGLPSELGRGTAGGVGVRKLRLSPPDVVRS